MEQPWPVVDYILDGEEECLLFKSNKLIRNIPVLAVADLGETCQLPDHYTSKHSQIVHWLQKRCWQTHTGLAQYLIIILACPMVFLFWSLNMQVTQTISSVVATLVCGGYFFFAVPKLTLIHAANSVFTVYIRWRLVAN